MVEEENTLLLPFICLSKSCFSFKHGCLGILLFWITGASHTSMTDGAFTVLTVKFYFGSLNLTFRSVQGYININAPSGSQPLIGCQTQSSLDFQWAANNMLTTKTVFKMDKCLI